MPELPEVETVRKGIAKHITKSKVLRVICRRKNLRWPIPVKSLEKSLPGQIVESVDRRGKYLLLRFQNGCLILHLGMSGTLLLLANKKKLRKHDHFELHLESNQILRLNDPRRFGAVLWEKNDPLEHRLLKSMAPEPLTRLFNKNWLYKKLRGRNASIKSLIMDNKIVAGVGNIYANESLHRAFISPNKAGKSLRKQDCGVLVMAIKTTLKNAIHCGGSTLRNYMSSDGNVGSFQLRYQVYNREGLDCSRCGQSIVCCKYNQRATYYCPKCQR